LNRALLLRLAAQFQGFAKDLHQETALAFGELVQPTAPTIALVVAAGLQTNRELDRGNAHETALASDFGRFGLKFWLAGTTDQVLAAPFARLFNSTPPWLGGASCASSTRVSNCCLPSCL
jgi:hypothetical protein